MKLMRNILGAAMAVTALAALSVPADAQPKRINMVVVSEDADTDTIPRGNRVFNRVEIALAEYLNARGFQIFDETAIGMAITTPNRVRRNNTELIATARAISARTPLDAILIFQIYASVRQDPYAAGVARPNVRIPARVLDVHTGQLNAAFEVGGFEFPPLPLNCANDRECLLETIGAEARRIAQDLGQAIEQKMANFTPGGVGGTTTGIVGTGTVERDKDGNVVAGTGGATVTTQPGCTARQTAFVIEVRDFDASELNQIESAMASFGCYVHHRAIRSTARSSDYWYETTSDSGQLGRNLRVMMDYLGVQGQVVLNGNKFAVTKVLTR